MNSREECVKALIATDALAESVDRIGSLDTLIPELGKTVVRIEELATRSGEIEERITATRERISGLEREAERMVESVGNAAYAAYTRSPSEFAAQEDLFAEALTLANELHDIDSELDRGADRSVERAFIKRVRSSGRKVYLSSRRLVKANGLSRAIRVLGKSEEVAALIGAGVDPQLSETGAEYQSMRAEAEKLSLAGETLAGELEEIGEELSSHGAARRPQRRADSLRREIAELETERDKELAAVGSTLAEARPETTAKRIAEKVEEAAEMRELMERHSAHAGRLEAAFELEAIEKAISGKRSTVDTLEREIRKRQESMGETEARIDELEQDRKAQEKIRGPADTLLDYEVG